MGTRGGGQDTTVNNSIQTTFQHRLDWWDMLWVLRAKREKNWRAIQTHTQEQQWKHWEINHKNEHRKQLKLICFSPVLFKITSTKPMLTSTQCVKCHFQPSQPKGGDTELYGREAGCYWNWAGIIAPGMVAHAWRLRQMGSDLKTSLTMGYVVSSKSAWTVQKNTVSKRQLVNPNLGIMLSESYVHDFNNRRN